MANSDKLQPVNRWKITNAYCDVYHVLEQLSAVYFECETRGWGWWCWCLFLHFIPYSFLDSQSATSQAVLTTPLSTVFSEVMTSSHCQHMGCPVLQGLVAGDHVLIVGPAPSFFSGVGGVAAAFTVSSFRAWLRASLRDLSPPTSRCCLTSQSFTPLTNERAASLQIKSWGNPTIYCPVGQLLNSCCKLQ
jgi:hypothetical protein